MESQNRVQWIYSSGNNQELAERYDQWAKDYDQDLDQDFGWLGPQKAAEILAAHVPKDSRILDAGAGTGLVGQCLAANGYHSLVAMDLSQGMLEASRKKNIYIEFHQMVMGEPLDFSSDSFGAVISVGVMTVGHAPASSLDELARITRPAGHVVFSLRPDVYETAGFKEKQQKLELAGTWELVEVTEEFQPMPKGEPEVYPRFGYTGSTDCTGYPNRNTYHASGSATPTPYLWNGSLMTIEGAEHISQSSWLSWQLGN